mmetsp:Transcript_10655/g.11711  ORF Transcript_10655/g.11711 Transcript_10655/m.11711 type:complete len:105 (-) Transcript_10655:35-349(-)
MTDTKSIVNTEITTNGGKKILVFVTILTLATAQAAISNTNTMAVNTNTIVATGPKGRAARKTIDPIHTPIVHNTYKDSKTVNEIAKQVLLHMTIFKGQCYTNEF